jgi:aspartyl-tRNA(Asn)/glutamyl-tRNA(Gln) amidotransferase subunit B
VCLGLPGALPVLNRRAVEYAIRAATALQCTIHETSVFARKNYFYPDLPKGYQITQYEVALATDGAIEYVSRGTPHRVGIVRVHLEEDAGKLVHSDSGGTYIDFNRSGTPLIEIVTAPDLRTPADAADCFSRLRAILMTLDVNDGNMEEGSLRCDANVSLRGAGDRNFGVKAEVKNVNSFRYLQRALEFEIDRQTKILNSGERVIQETRLWDSVAGRTVSMRSKEEAHDYRYFPEPDLPPLTVTAEMMAAARDGMPELPEARRQRFVTQYSLPDADAALLSQTTATASYFEEAAAAAGDARATANWIVGDLQRKLKERGVEIQDSPVSPHRLAGLVQMVTGGAISGPVAKHVFERMCEGTDTAEDIVRREKLGRIDDTAAIEGTVAAVLRDHATAVAEYRAGKVKTFGFLVGQVMKATGGKANPELVNAAVKKALG